MQDRKGFCLHLQFPICDLPFGFPSLDWVKKDDGRKFWEMGRQKRWQVKTMLAGQKSLQPPETILTRPAFFLQRALPDIGTQPKEVTFYRYINPRAKAFSSS